MYDDETTHDGIIYTIVARIGWKEFRSFIKDLKLLIKEYKTEHGINGIPFPIFCEYVNPICEDTEDNREEAEMYFWCMGHKII